MQRYRGQVRVVEHAGEMKRTSEHVREAIRTGALPPGARIRDAVIADELGIPRAIVRVALRELERVGLVRETRSRFYRVAEHAPDRFHIAMECLGIEVGIGLHLALARVDSAARVRLAQLFRALAALCDEGQHTPEVLYGAARVAFDATIEAAGNPFLRVSFDRAWGELMRSTRGGHPLLNPPEFIAARAREVATAIQASDARTAERCLGRIFRADMSSSVS
ncbi:MULTISPECIES: GntR family transcriptional regulator [Microbacterium]|uniref:HTH gntR-type domain-containing protein n=1 Tax=Microbacterium barkeri TaxID=33917 RepID=A0A9W6H244_9MICO|nr:MULTISPECIES: GntR family transcriptional regulator [Microbacterium]MDI6942591.1 GntR family transcriptional regulator [Microbacterium barkeri]MDR6875248.1 DNA-binding GntR family transcriptional regulator [Microbacterium barkeri]WRH18131.1 GntR family transcriptional regulator [Microbacterium sp. JZ37]GLJ60589.1 hypothetical protein GCM10017576_07180 [Microbacterium barkeri]